MRTPYVNPWKRREAFTLVEMLVVISMILLLAAVAILFVPRMNERQHASRGADRLQACLLIARMRALRYQQPRGIRITPVPVGGPVIPGSQTGEMLGYLTSTSTVTPTQISAQSTGTPVTV